MQERHQIYEMYERIDAQGHSGVAHKNYLPLSMLMKQSYDFKAHGSSRYILENSQWETQNGLYIILSKFG